MVDTAYEIQKECERLVRTDPGGPRLDVRCGINEVAAVIGAFPTHRRIFFRDVSVTSQVRHDGQRTLQDIRQPHQHRHTRVRRHPRGKEPCRTGERTSR